MSQNENKFQSKSRSPGGKFGSKGKGGGGGFGKRFEGDRDKPRGGGYKGRSADGERSGRSEGGYKGKRTFGGDRDSRPPREGGDRPYQKREYKPREDRGGSDRPYAKREYKPREDRGERKSFGDRPKRDYKPREDRGSDRPYEKREYKPREDRGERKSFGDRPKRDYKPREDRGSDRPYEKREYKPREDRGGGDRPRSGGKSFGRRPDRGVTFANEASERPARAPREGGFEKRSFDKEVKEGENDGKPSPRRSDRFGGSKPYKRYDEKPRYEPRSEDSFGASADFGGEGLGDARSRLKSDRAGYGSPSSAFLYGVHAVTQALKNPKRLHQRLLCTERGYASIEKAYTEATAEGLKMPTVTYVGKEDIDRLLPRDAVHQDILLDCQPLEDIFLVDFLPTLGADAKILVLDQVTDPHNVGAIIRSAAAFGAAAVVTQKLHTPDITGTLAKSASGAVEHVPLIKEVNLSRALEQLKEAGFFCIGLAEEGKQTLAGLKLSGKVALVLGNEGDGLRRLVAENCDELAKLPTQGEIASLNVSNAAAISLYELTRK